MERLARAELFHSDEVVGRQKLWRETLETLGVVHDSGGRLCVSPVAASLRVAACELCVSPVAAVCVPRCGCVCPPLRLSRCGFVPRCGPCGMCVSPVAA
jgi:hypothetical protein